MQNKRLEMLLPIAYEALAHNETIVKNGEIEKTFRGQISAFGAAILTGSLTTAVAFYSVQGKSKTPRQALLEVILEVLDKGKLLPKDEINEIFKDGSVPSYTVDNMKKLVFGSKDPELQEKILDASVAIKLAMNFFTLIQ